MTTKYKPLSRNQQGMLLDILAEQINKKNKSDLNKEIENNRSKIDDLFFRRNREVALLKGLINKKQELKNKTEAPEKTFFVIRWIKKIKSPKYEEAKERLEQKTRNTASNIKGIDSTIRRCIRKVKSLKTTKINRAYLLNQLNEIMKFSEVEAVYTIKNGIIVETNDIICNKKNIGEYIIIIDLYHKKVKVERRDDTVFSYNDRRKISHPHVKGGGVCYGTISGKVNNSIKKGKFYDVVLATLSVLQQANPGDAYMPLGEFTRRIKRKRTTTASTS